MRRIARILVLTAAVPLVSCGEAKSPTEVAPLETRPSQNGTYQTAWIYLKGAPVEVKFEEVGGNGILEGDMVLGPVKRLARTRAQLEGSGGGVNLAVTNAWDCILSICNSRRWPDGMVPYEIGPGFSVAQQAEIMRGMTLISSRASGVLFVPRTWWHPNWIEFRTAAPGICQSPIGMRGDWVGPGGGQVIQLANTYPSCFNMRGGIVAHEILHSLGALHEQSRCDRGNFVSIIWGNIQENKKVQFEQRCAGADDLLAYTDESLMHYEWNAFANNYSLPTIVSLRGRPLGQRDSLATNDWQSLNLIYPPYLSFGLTVTNSGGVPLLSWNPRFGAVNYSVTLVSVYEYFNDWEGTSESYDAWTDGGVSTTGTTWLDTQHPYTGESRCIVNQSMYYNEGYSFYYEISATFLPSGTQGQPFRYPAPVAPPGTPCW